MFDRFARSGAALIDPAPVTRDIGSLQAVIADVNAFTSKSLAHRDDKVGPDAPSAPTITWADLDAAIDKIGTIHKKYYTLAHPGEALGSLTPLQSLEWTQLCQAAWMPPGFRVPDDLDFDPPT
jgi:hypothetical protein